jgi:hypothetical protein
LTSVLWVAELIIAVRFAGTVIVVITLGASDPFGGVLLPLLGVLPLPLPPLLGVLLLPLPPLLLPPLGVLLLVVVVTPFTLIEAEDMPTVPQVAHSIVRAPAVTVSICASPSL